MSARRTLYRGQVVDLGIEDIQLANGQQLQLEVVRHPGGAAIIALNTDNEVCLLRQYRHAGGGWLWELPAGKLEAGETALSTAQRELEEEAGVQAQHWQALTSILTTPGFCDEVIHLFLARELCTVATQHEAHECIEVHWMNFESALAMAYNGEIRDAKTLLGLFYSAALILNQVA